MRRDTSTLGIATDPQFQSEIRGSTVRSRGDFEVGLLDHHLDGLAAQFVSDHPQSSIFDKRVERAAAEPRQHDIEIVDFHLERSAGSTSKRPES